MYTIKLFKFTSNQTYIDTYITYEKCSSFDRLDQHNIQFTDKDGKIHFSNLKYEAIEQ